MNENRVEFTPEMRKTHTILAPTMLPIHFGLFEQILKRNGYKIEILKTMHPQIMDEGLKNVHNDTCYPALLVIGQMIDALKSGKYDPDKTALMITQTGGGCRASNYISLLRKALVKSGYPNVPVISLNLAMLEKNSGFHLTLPMLVQACFAAIYGDMLMCLSNQCKPYETSPGRTQRVLDKWTAELGNQFKNGGYMRVKKNYRHILNDFDSIPKTNEQKIKVGIVGEIYLKYSPLGNNALEDFLIAEGAEPVVSGVLDFALFGLSNSFMDHKLYGRKGFVRIPSWIAMQYMLSRQKQMINAIREHGTFTPPTGFKHLPKLVDGVIGRGTKMGEGWLLTAEMLEYIDSGINNIVCAQPFGCLPNHIVAKGMMRKIKDAHPNANIVAIDYDPGATKINQENRLKLMLANARANEKAAQQNTAQKSLPAKEYKEKAYV